MRRLEGKVAIITGGARGMGAAEATLFASEGACVVVADVLDDETTAVVADINRMHGKDVALAVHLDVSNSAQWQQAIAMTISRFGGLDILVNNAAILVEADIVDTTEDEWERVIGVNQKGTWLGMKFAVPAMRERGGGSIINISSMGGLVGTAGYAAYHSTKGAVRLLSKHGAAAYGKDNIRCNTIYPGPIMTPMLGNLAPEAYQVTVDATLLKRMGRVDDVATAVLFLASDEASFITGADLTVDGGYTAV